MWKDINGYGGRYKINENGEIISNAQGKWKRLKYGNSRGYYVVTLYIPEQRSKKTNYVHRLVAETFIPNFDNLPQVNHKDENIHNNNVSNLEWCTCEYNVNYGTRTLRASKSNMGKTNKPVIRIDDDGNEFRFNSIKEAVKSCGSRHVWECCNGVRTKCGGYMWKYA